MTTPPATSSQMRIWQHFQNAAPDAFAAARPRLDWLLAQVARRTRGQSPAILNIGIGDGYFERQAQSRGWQIHALDPDPDAVARLVEAGIAAQVGQIQQIPLPSQSQEHVVASEVLEHLTDDERLAGLAEIARVLADGGGFLGTVPYGEVLSDQQAVCPHCGQVFHRWGHERSFVEEDIREQLAPWFDVELLGRTAFVRWQGRGLRGAVKSAARWLLAKLGEPAAYPTLYWIAKKSRTPAAVSLKPAAAPA
jgi:SAM-dependent methyltransferase